MAIDRRLEFGSAHWRDLAEVSKTELEAVAKEYGLSLHMVADCLDPDHLPKIMRTTNVTFMMLRAFDDHAPAEANSVQESTRKVAVFWGDNFLLTVHRSSLNWLNGVWSDWERKSERAPNQIASLVHDLVEECIFTYEEPIDAAAVEVEKLEDSIFRDGTSPTTGNDVLETAYMAKKRGTLFKRMLRLSRDLLPSLSKLGDVNSPAIQSLKEEADRLYYYSDDLVETANDLVQLSISLTSNRTNQVVRMLTLVSIFLMPLNVVTGIYGMNFEFMPELHWAWGYPLAIALMIAIELGIFWLLKHKRWIR